MKQNSIKTKINSIIISKMSLLIIFLILQLSECIEIGNIILSTSTISQTSSYTFYLQRDASLTNIPTNAYLTITFPTAFINRLAIVTGSQVSCSSKQLTSSTLTCLYGQNVLTIMNAFPTANSMDSFTLVVNGITNPFPAENYSPFTASLYYSQGMTFEDGISPATITTTAGQSTCSILSYVNNKVYSRGTIVVNYQSQYATNITDQYKMSVIMNNYYPNDPLQTNVNAGISGYSSLGNNFGSYNFIINYTNTITISLLMPPSTQGALKFIQIQAYIINIGAVDSCYVSLSNVDANSLLPTINATSLGVQQLSTYTFSINPNSPIFSTDSLVVQFPTSYDLLTVTTASFTSGVSGSKSITKNSNILTIASLAAPYIQNKVITFIIQNIKNPFDLRPVIIKMRTLTNQSFVRDSSSLIITLLNGLFQVNSFQCNNYQIGYETPCYLNFTLTNTIKQNCQIRITFPSSSWMLSQSGSNTQCASQSSSSQLNSQFECRFSGNTLVLSQFAPTTNSSLLLEPFTSTVTLDQSSIDINNRLHLPWSVGPYSFSISSYSVDNYLIDSGSFSLATIKRQLFSTSNNTIQFETKQTMTASNIYLNYNLPIDKGIGYMLNVYLPLELTNDVTSIISSYGNVIGYNMLTNILQLRLADVTLHTQNITISGFKTYDSVQPITYSYQLLYGGIAYFYYSQSVAITNPKTLSVFTLQQTSFVVYKFDLITLTVSQLQNGDILSFSTVDYTQFSVLNQSLCTSSVISCNLDGTLTILNANNLDASLKLSKFSFNIRNPPYVGNGNISLSIYDKTKNYLKQIYSFFVLVSSPNILPSNLIVFTSSNPYFNQTTTLSIVLTLQTPNSSFLQVSIPNQISYVSFACIKNCINPTFNQATNQILIGIVGLSVSFQAQIKNAFNFDSNFSIVSKDTSSRNRDYGIFKLQQICNSPCRSCSTSNASVCLSCYSFQTNKTLSNGKCLVSCPLGQYQIIQSLLYNCVSCPIECSSCSSASLCLSCKSAYIFNNSTCLSQCPVGYYSLSNMITNLFECTKCALTCSKCSSANFCSECAANYYFYQNSCRNDCPFNYYVASGQCLQCPINCAHCQNISGLCDVCNYGYFLYQGNCFSNCTVNGYAKNSSSGKCEFCPLPCVSCGEFVTICTKCQSGSYLLDQICINDCTSVDGYFNIQSNNICGSCQSPCRTCSNSATYCKNCVAGMIYYSNQCLWTCPNGTYQQFVNNVSICTSCIWPCMICVDQSTCVQCSNPYILKNSTCISSCLSSQFVNSNNQCEVCASKCLACNKLGCLSCSNSSKFLSSYDCVSSCSPLFQNANTIRCESCQSPCQSCSLQSTKCQSCIQSYNLYTQNSICLKVCPITYFSNNFICQLCFDRNIYCKQCQITNGQFQCMKCQQNNFFWGFVCVGLCPNNSVQQNGACISQNCTQISSCQVCSDTKCLACQALYTLINGSCQFRVLSAISSVPVPFPFLILTIFTIISSFLLKHLFPKMYIPLYLYSICGLFECLNIALWTLLAVWMGNINMQQTFSNTYSLTMVICGVYAIFNLSSCVYNFWIRFNDKRYRIWEKQDNRLASIIIDIISLLLSFRFLTLKFSKLGHKQYFSATLQSSQKYSPLNILSILSILIISLPAMLLSAYLTYKQVQMNYLFFTSLQLALVSFIMVIFSFMTILIPKDYFIQKKIDYFQGFDQDELEGKSVEEIMGMRIGEEQYYQGISMEHFLNKQNQVIQRNILADQDQYTTQHKYHINQHKYGINQHKYHKISVDKKSQAIQNLTQSKVNSVNDINQSYQVIKSDNDLSSTISMNELIQNQQSKLQLDEIQVITGLMQQTLKRKHQILASIIKQQDQLTIQQINSKYANNLTVQPNNKPYGYIVRKLLQNYNAIQQDEQQDIGDQINSNSQKSNHQSEQLQNDRSNQLQQMSSSKVLRFNQDSSKFNNQSRKKYNKQYKLDVTKPKLISHQTLSLDEQLNYKKIQQKKQNKMKNEKNLQRIKLLVQQLRLQQFQQKALNGKLLQLNQKQIQLTNEQKQKVRLKMQRNRMCTEEQLSKLNQMFNKRKQKQLKKKQQRNKIQNDIQQAKLLGIQQPIQLRQLVYTSLQNNIQEIQLKQLKVQAKKGTKNIQNLSRIGAKTSITLKPQYKINNETKKIQEKVQKQQINSKKGSIHNKKGRIKANKGVINKKANQLLTVSEQIIKNKQQIIKRKLKQQNVLSESNQKKYQKHQQNYHDEFSQQQQAYLQNNHQSLIKPLKFNQLLEQIDSQQFYQQQHTLGFQYNQNQKWHVNQQEIKDLIYEQDQQHDQQYDQEYNMTSDLINAQGQVQKMGNFTHWPIDPALQKKILQVQQKANTYLTQNKSRIKKPHPNRFSNNLNHFVSEQLPLQKGISQQFVVHQYQDDSHSSEKMFRFSAGNFGRRKQIQPQASSKQQNSLFDLKRDSQMDDLYEQKGQVLVFDDEQIMDQEQPSQQYKNANILQQHPTIILNVEKKDVIPKRRVNRSVINLSPNKY